MRMVESKLETTIVNADDQGGFALAKIESINRRTKHIDVRNYYTGDAAHRKLVLLTHCGTNRIAADMHRKALGRMKLAFFRRQCRPQKRKEEKDHVTEERCWNIQSDFA